VKQAGAREASVDRDYLEEEWEVAAPPRGDGGAERVEVPREPVPEELAVVE